MSGAIGSFAIGVSGIGASGSVALPTLNQTFSSTASITGTLIPFAPTTVAVPTFQATLDSALYSCTATWNIYRAGSFSLGWYLNIFGQNNTLVLTVPLVGSPPPPAPGVNLVGGFFTTSTMYYYPVTKTIVVAP
jgi:hypothetical protein